MEGLNLPGVVKTITGKCGMCYACVRECPVKAIKVVAGQAQVMPERCVACGHCIQVCSRKAKMVQRDVEKVEQFLTSGQTIACLAPSFVAEFYSVLPGQVVAALKILGFAEVHEVAFGADMVTQEGRQYLKEAGEKRGFISTPCPAVVNIVTKYYPHLIPQLVPVVSPMIALGRYLKKRGGPKNSIVFIGPCIAKKAEAQEEEVAGAIDAVLTFSELKEMLATREIDINTCGNSDFDSEPAFLGRLYPVGGGLLLSAGIDADILKNQAMVVEGREDCLDFLEASNEEKMMFPIVDLLFCKGCINGPIQGNNLSNYKRRKVIAEYTRQGLRRSRPQLINLKGISLRRQFHDRHVVFCRPSETDIRMIMAELGKYGPEDELNCGACGYRSCREKAVAVYNGQAETCMCLPYLITRLEENNLYLRQELKAFWKQYDEFIGNSEAMREVFDYIEKIAKTNVAVLIRGEAGTDTRLLARNIHYNSHRANGPFVSVNCALLSEDLLARELFGCAEGPSNGASSYKKGYLEEAHQGTIYIEEIGDMSLGVQKKLFHALQEGELFPIGVTVPIRIDVRVIAASSQDLEAALKQDSIHAELYYSLNAVSIRVPPLRERRDDIPLLACYYKDKICERLEKKVSGFTSEVMDVLVRYDWPGNEREMEGLIENAVILAEGKKVEIVDLPRRLRNLAARASGWAYTKGMTLNEAVTSYECSLIMHALEECRGVQARAAEILGLKRSTLNEKIKRYKIKTKFTGAASRGTHCDE